MASENRPGYLRPVPSGDEATARQLTDEAYEPVGCARCSHSGYRGRIGLFSVMVMSDEIKSLTVQRAPEAEIAEVARSQGMITVREDGLQKARAGVTSIEEIARVTT
jgi:type IV pilus assembly protein PilB